MKTTYNLPKPVLIFDFDGTIADTFSPAMQILGTDFKKWGDKFNKKTTVAQMRDLSVQEIIGTVPGGWWKFAYLLFKVKHKIARMIPQIEAYPGMVYTLRSLHERGYAMIIVTSNDRSAVIDFLHKYNLQETFLEVYPTKGLFRKAKCLIKVLQKYNLKTQDAFYIGDEIRDIQACHKINLPIISVGYGFNSITGLEKYLPEHLIKKPTQLLELLEKNPPHLS